ncbi:MAG TPA: GDP-mannose 4,6-dehydratase, partial [Nitrospinaceae bacterium]|nr:GDP-mannose 4,6-dehydratase [Nitrospinaceae bacterium]
MKTIFVTGGAGFIGSNFVMSLVESGRAKVINYDKLTYAGNLDTLAPVAGNPNHIFIQGDITHRQTVLDLLEKQIAAKANSCQSVSRKRTNPHEA